MLKDILFASSLIIAFSVGVGVLFVRTILEMLEIFLRGSGEADQISGRHIR
ncbi:MAG: hypothetical protein HQM08_14770 [Candidatus Riflebacteria bacterium]|nr:hypothetical protein [Candidatus Riflebacteria bacterium]